MSSVSHDIAAFPNANIFICGDLMLDVYIEGKVSRISPEAPVPVVQETGRRAVLGGAGNVAANIASLGAKAFLCGRVGVDEDARSLDYLCQEKKITTNWFRHPKIPTIRKTRVMAGQQQIVRIDSEKIEPLLEDESNFIIKCFQGFCQTHQNRALVISDYGKGVISNELLEKLIQIAKSNKTPVIADPKSNDLNRYSGCTILKPNRKEGREIANRLGVQFEKISVQQEATLIIDAIFSQTQIDTVVLSLSEHGVAYQSRNEKASHIIPSRALEVADVSGAGDTMVACLALGSALALPMARVVQIANVASGVVCTKAGTAVVTPTELLQAFQRQFGSSSNNKIIPMAEIEVISHELRAQNRKVVFTNGCFDILHAGHLLSLQRARQFGDYLIVGLNSDASTKRLKGPHRPITHQDDRASLLAGLACVDAVVIFEEDTPLDLIKKVKPQVLVKGGDYKAQNIVGFKEVTALGGTVEIIPLLEGRSTTQIEKLLKGDAHRDSV